MTTPNLLRIYLRDHHAAATAGCELAERSAKSNEGTTFGQALASLRDEIRDDLTSLEELMARLDVTPAKGKDAAMWLAEKAGRLKLNGSLTSYSPLSRLIELEGLAIGVEGKLSLWRSLKELDDPRLDKAALLALERRGEDQRRRIEESRLEAARIALATT